MHDDCKSSTMIYSYIVFFFPFFDGDVPSRASYGIYISQLIRFARVCMIVADFNARIKCLTDKLIQQSYRYHKLRKTFRNFIADTITGDLNRFYRALTSLSSSLVVHKI